MSKYIETNKMLWETKTGFHLKSDFYQMEAFKAGKNMLKPIELQGLGEVSGKSLLHLQCHFGQDSLCWARLGANVTGIDFSEKSTAAARSLSKELGIDARFLISDVLELQDNLEGQFDIVYTSYGVLGWLPDLDRWAKVIAHFLKPGGTFYIAEFHPFLYIHEFDDQKIAYPYFNPGVPFEEEEEGTYADPSAQIKQKEYFWMHSLSEVFQALFKVGLEIKDFREYDFSPYNCLPHMVERKKGEFIYGDYGVNLPHVFAIKARKSQELSIS